MRPETARECRRGGGGDTRGFSGNGAATEERSEAGPVVVECGVDRMPKTEAAEFFVGTGVVRTKAAAGGNLSAARGRGG